MSRVTQSTAYQEEAERINAHSPEARKRRRDELISAARRYFQSDEWRMIQLQSKTLQKEIPEYAIDSYAAEFVTQELYRMEWKATLQRLNRWDKARKALLKAYNSALEALTKSWAYLTEYCSNIGLAQDHIRDLTVEIRRLKTLIAGLPASQVETTRFRLRRQISMTPNGRSVIQSWVSPQTADRNFEVRIAFALACAWRLIDRQTADYSIFKQRVRDIRKARKRGISRLSTFRKKHQNLVPDIQVPSA